MHPAWFSGGTRHQSLYHECHEHSEFSYAASRAFPAKGSFYEGVIKGIASLRVVDQADITFVNWETSTVHTIGLSSDNSLLAVANLPGAC
jgi:hypothetical protein